jgi:predicted RNase H-like nuclease (RuvC/YqgF family)
LQLQVHLTDQICISENASRELQKTEAVITDLKKQLEAKEEALKDSSEKRIQLQTVIDSLTKTVESLSQTAALLYQKQEELEKTIDGLRKTVDSLNQTSRVLCGTPECVSTCKVEVVTVSSLKYLRQSATLNCGQASTFLENCSTTIFRLTFRLWSYVTGIYIQSSFRDLHQLKVCTD